MYLIWFSFGCVTTWYLSLWKSSWPWKENSPNSPPGFFFDFFSPKTESLTEKTCNKNSPLGPNYLFTIFQFVSSKWGPLFPPVCFFFGSINNSTFPLLPPWFCGSTLIFWFASLRTPLWGVKNVGCWVGALKSPSDRCGMKDDGLMFLEVCDIVTLIYWDVPLKS